MTKQLFFLEWIYEHHLKVIRNVEFSPRQIDVIACICNGRNAGTAASLFLLSPRTVDTHLNAIMLKLGCNTQSAIKSFIEKSGKLSWIHTYYISLLAHDAFTKGLKKLSLQARNQNLQCKIFHWISDEDQKLFLDQLKSDLEQSGVQISLEDIKDQETNREFLKFHSSTNLILCMGPSSLLAELEKSLEGQNLNSSSRIMIHLEDSEKEGNSVSEKFLKYGVQSDYYEVALEVLKQAHPKSDLNALFSEFKTHIETISHQGKAAIEASPGKNTFFAAYLQRFLEFSKFKKSLYMMGCCVPLLLGVGVFWVSSPPILKDFPIRSELKIPAESGFLNRSEIIKKIEEKLQRNEGIERVVLVGVVGIGGAGKTTLARQFGRLQNAPVVWELNAETKDSLVNSFKELAYKLAKTEDQKKELEFIQAIQNPEEKEKQLFSFVKDRLREKLDWLLIYDNVDNLAEMKSYFPEDPKVWGKGKVVITTRDKSIAHTTYIKPEDIVNIEELNEEEKLTLFSKIIFGVNPDKLLPEQRERAVNFLKHIPPFPLDVSVSAYYIKNTQITYDQYLERMGKYSEKFDQVQTDLLKEISNYTKTRYGIITLSLKKIIDENPEFKELLFFICLLDSQNIPKELLEFYKDKDTVDGFIHSLQKESLIVDKPFSEKTSTLPAFSIHRSTQAIGLAFLKNLLTENDKEILLKKIILIMNSFHKKNYVIRTLLIPHLESLIQNLPEIIKDKKLIKEYEIDVLLALGYAHLRCSRNLIVAKKYFTFVYKNHQSNPYITNKKLAVLLSDLGEICTVPGDRDAPFYCQESIKLCKMTPNTEILMVKNLKSLGHYYIHNGNFKKAKYYLEAALNSISKVDKNLKRESEADIYGSLAMLYSVFYLKGEGGLKAEEYALKSLKILNATDVFCNIKNKQQEKISCMIARSKSWLGQVYRRASRYKEAMEKGFKDAQYIIDYSLDNCSHQIGKTLINLGIGEILLRENKLEDAEKKLTKSVAAIEKLINIDTSFPAKAFRIETRIRLGKLTEAYQD